VAYVEKEGGKKTASSGHKNGAYKVSIEEKLMN
jgi:hypothetical protein